MGQEAQSSISYISIIVDQQDEENPEETTEGDKKKRKRKRKRKDKTQVRVANVVADHDDHNEGIFK